MTIVTNAKSIRFIACLAVVTIAALAQGFAPANAEGREPVLKQVAVPHSYYWREMYIPQLTTGPSGAAWSRDGKSLYFSAKGRIWRQKLTSDVAEQVTGGDGYDYQPDISPDGKRMVFARYAQDAIELVVRDLRSGREEPLSANGGVNIDPRWSPDGQKIAFVTTDETGNFHIAIAQDDGREWTVNRWRDERTTQAPRYYYSQTDHELSPAWSPDGRELMFVSNADLRHGAGFIFRQAIDLSTPPVIVREEETSWKAAPDFSPDGKRVAYASYLGRQWHQLWMVSADSGDYPMPFTYGDFDIQRPRWSPDGESVAYVTNENGALAIAVQEIVGGARTVLTTKHWASREKTAPLTITTLDEDGAAAPARISVRTSDGRDHAPDGAMFHADDSYDRMSGPSEIHYFHSAGAATVSLPPGEAMVTVWRGLETAPVRRSIVIKRGEAAATEIRLQAIDDGAFSTWRSADVHVHMNYGGAYRMTPDRLAAQADAEDLDLVFNLLVNKEQRIPDIDYFTPVPVRPEATDAIIAQAQEFHTSIWGHLGLLGLDDHLLISDYAGYPETAAHSLYPDNPTIADLAHKQSALVGYVHPFDSPAPDPTSDRRLTHMLPVNAALGKIDYLEVVGFSDHRTTEEVWHRLLNCGFRIPAAGGTDAMTNYASLRGPLGVDRTYVEMAGDRPADPAAFVRAWLSGLKAGRSFATNGPLVKLEVDGAAAGEVITRKKGVWKLSYKARVSSIAPIDTVEILYNGKVVAALAVSDDGRQVDAAGEIEVDASGWLSLRASGAAADDVFDLYPYGVTSPIYVEVGGRKMKSAADADYFIAWIEKLESFAEASDAYNTDAERKAVLANLAAAKKEFNRRR